MCNPQLIIIRCAMACLLSFGMFVSFAWAQEPLPVDEAFQVEVLVEKGSSVRLTFTAEDGYYLYRDRIKIESAQPGMSLQPFELPAGKSKQDPLFGEVQIWRGGTTVDIGIDVADGLSQAVIKVQYQGCADMGVCYPPQTRDIPIRLPRAPEQSGGFAKFLSSMTSGFGQGAANDTLLPPEQAFHVFAEAGPNSSLILNWQIAEGYYLYRDKITVTPVEPADVRLGALQLPKGKSKEDAIFGQTEVYYDTLEAKLPVTFSDAESRSVRVKVGYQGCAEIGVCYPPMTNTLNVVWPGDQAGGEPAKANPVRLVPVGQAMVSTGSRQSEQDRLAQSIHQGSLGLTILSFFGFGLLLAFTPCVFPMIPILSGIIVGHGHQITTRKALILSTAYVLASALTYTVFGVLAGLFGSNLQAVFQNSWVIYAFSALFVVLALSMFGLFQLQLPDSIRSKLAQANQSQPAGTPVGAAVMGVLSTLIVGPCVAPPLAGALIYIGQTGDALLGGVALFALGLGMGAPLLLIGTSAGRWLPKAGEWMEVVKSVFGVLLLAVAIWLLDRVVAPQVTMLLSAALLIVSSVFVGVLDALPEKAHRWQRLAKGFGLILLIYGLVLMVGAAVGGGNVLSPLRGLGQDTSNQAAHSLPFQPVSSRQQLQQALVEAGQNQQLVMLDFYADWCVSCKEMEAFTFSDPQVQAQLSSVRLLQIDVTENQAEHQALLNQFGLIGPPAILFFSPGAIEQRGHRIVGYMPAREFKQHLQSVTTCVQTIAC